jgi:Flp pilus assembly CpaE family ATPase
MQLVEGEWWWSLTMAKFATLIWDSDLESLAIKAIAQVNGELAFRAVASEQLSQIDPSIILIANIQVSLRNPTIFVSSEMNFETIAQLLTNNIDAPKDLLIKGNRKVISFLGLTGGAGTTSIAINYAFELAEQTEVALLDLDTNHPEIARSLGLYRIDERTERVGRHLQIHQGLPAKLDCEIFVLDLGSNWNHSLLKQSDLIYIVSRLDLKTAERLKALSLDSFSLICNFFERGKAQTSALKEIENLNPRLEITKIPYDPKSFEIASERKSALLEVFPNSPARKALATLR